MGYKIINCNPGNKEVARLKPHDPTQPPPKRRAGQLTTKPSKKQGHGLVGIVPDDVARSLGANLDSARKTAWVDNNLMGRLRFFSLLQIRLLIPDEIYRVPKNRRLIAVVELPPQFPRGPHPKRIRIHDGLLRNQRA